MPKILMVREIDLETGNTSAYVAVTDRAGRKIFEMPVSLDQFIRAAYPPIPDSYQEPVNTQFRVPQPSPGEEEAAPRPVARPKKSGEPKRIGDILGIKDESAEGTDEIQGL